MLFSEILSGHSLNVVNVARADCVFSIMTTVATFITFQVMYELFYDKHVIQIGEREAPSRG